MTELKPDPTILSASSPDLSPATGTQGKLKLGPILRIPWRKITVGMVAAPLALAILWSLCAPLWGWEGWQMAIRGLIVIVPIAIVGWLCTAPWRLRPAMDWITIWLVGTVIRLLLTPIACLALYSQAPCDKSQFVAAVGACYFAVVLEELGMIALTLPRAAVGDAS